MLDKNGQSSIDKNRKRLGFRTNFKKNNVLNEPQAKTGQLRDKIVNFKHNKEVFDINYMKHIGKVGI